MDKNQLESCQINEANYSLNTNTEDSCLIALEKGSEGNRHCRSHHGRREGKCRSQEIKEDKKGKRSVIKDQKEKAVEVLKELNKFHLEVLTDWKTVIRECVCVLEKLNQRGDEDRDASTEDSVDIFLSVGEDIDNLMDRVTKIIPKLDEALLRLFVHEESTSAAAFQESRDSNASAQPEDIRNLSENSLELKEEVQDDQKNTMDSGFNSSNCSKDIETQGESQIRGQREDVHYKTTLREAEVRDRENESEWRKDDEWITVRLTGQMDDPDKPTNACYIKAPAGALKCEAADTLSCLMVSGSEELVSRVVRIKVQDGDTFRFPVTVAMPFCVRHHSSHREVAVKIVDEEKRVSFITPVITDGVHRGRKGCFAEVKVYSLGIFAVVSCLKREMYHIPRRGLSLKIPMDPQISLNYLPGSFTGPVIAQTMVQPVDAVLLVAVKSRNDAYESVVSASPLLHLTHPNSQPLRRPLTITLPCPQNPETKETKRRKESQEHHDVAPSGSLLPSDKLRSCGAYVSSNERSNELLVVLGSKDEQWAVLEKTAIKNQQNGVVSFDITENFDRLVVVRLCSPLQPCHLTTLAEELEDSACHHSVTVVLQHGQDDPHSILLTALPSRHLSWELKRLRGQGCCSLMETSSEISLREGDHLLLRLSGNITSTASTQNNTCEDPHGWLTFHYQRRNQLLVHLTEVDPFGNYSSHCYKGMALFYRVSRAEMEWRGDRAVLKDAKLLGNLVCKLPLSLPKKVRVIHRPIATRVKISEEAETVLDTLLIWLSGELSQEDTALLVSSLHLSRSAAQLVKLRSRGSPSEQAFRILAMWRRTLPSVTCNPKASQLAHILAKIGRADLARELLLREAELSKTRRFEK